MRPPGKINSRAAVESNDIIIWLPPLVRELAITVTGRQVQRYRPDRTKLLVPSYSPGRLVSSRFGWDSGRTKPCKPEPPTTNTLGIWDYSLTLMGLQI